MLRVSRMADYATLIMGVLKHASASSLSAVEVSQRADLPQPIVRKLLKLLLKAGLVRSKQGIYGGYQLAQDAQHISLFDIVTAIDGPMALTVCGVSEAQCSKARHCHMRSMWDNVSVQIANILRSFHLSDFSEGGIECVVPSLRTTEEKHAHTAQKMTVSCVSKMESTACLGAKVD